LIQLKSLLAERERLSSDLRSRTESVQADQERAKALETRLSQAMQQKEAAVGMLERVKEALPTEGLQRVFGEMVRVVEDGFRVEEECERAEGELIAKEGELRACMKKEV
jgi:DNA repair exonuclease SbcCD ATPase subunit